MDENDRECMAKTYQEWDKAVSELPRWMFKAK